MTSRANAAALLALATWYGALATASAADQPISAVKLVMTSRSNGKQKLAFVSKDPAFLFPAIGGADDPALGTPGGATVELFSANEGAATLAMPAGVGKPGWTVKAAAVSSFKYVNPLSPAGDSPVRVALLKEGKMLKVTARTVGDLPLAVAQGAVGVRLTTGTLRSCALFDAATIRQDVPGRFVARNAVATSLTDCTNASLGATECADGDFASTLCGGSCPAGSACGTQDLSTCICIAAAQPCGDTSPVCNGECPADETCAAIGGFPLPACGCIPTGSTPCGGFQCGATCPSGLECNFFVFSIPGAPPCLCGPPGPCGSGGDDCPIPYVCASGPGFTGCVLGP